MEKEDARPDAHHEPDEGAAREPGIPFTGSRGAPKGWDSLRTGDGRALAPALPSRLVRDQARGRGRTRGLRVLLPHDLADSIGQVAGDCVDRRSNVSGIPLLNSRVPISKSTALPPRDQASPTVHAVGVLVATAARMLFLAADRMPYVGVDHLATFGAVAHWSISATVVHVGTPELRRDAHPISPLWVFFGMLILSRAPPRVGAPSPQLLPAHARESSGLGTPGPQGFHFRHRRHRRFLRISEADLSTGVPWTEPGVVIERRSASRLKLWALPPTPAKTLQRDRA